MSEAIPRGAYPSLWDWVETSRAGRFRDHEMQNVMYMEDTLSLSRPKGVEPPAHPGFQKQSVTIPKAFVAVLPQGRYWVAENRMAAIIAPDNKIILDMSMQYYRPNSIHPVYKRRELPQAKATTETVAVLNFIWDNNYYHWLGEVLARIHLLDKSGIRIDKYIVHRQIYRKVQWLHPIPKGNVGDAGHTGTYDRAERTGNAPETEEADRSFVRNVSTAAFSAPFDTQMGKPIFAYGLVESDRVPDRHRLSANLRQPRICPSPQSNERRASVPFAKRIRISQGAARVAHGCRANTAFRFRRYDRGPSWRRTGQFVVLPAGNEGAGTVRTQLREYGVLVFEQPFRA
ncbi:MAG: hypothetical protein K0R28_1987 [Paenibacillus sp.]|nr:hypothetical protein [Paenibacillus sp.]